MDYITISEKQLADLLFETIRISGGSTVMDTRDVARLMANLRCADFRPDEEKIIQHVLIDTFYREHNRR
jgi:hypothetical protein